MPRFNPLNYTDEQATPPPLPAHLLRDNPWARGAKLLKKKCKLVKDRFNYLKKFGGKDCPLKAFPALPWQDGFLRYVLTNIRGNWNYSCAVNDGYGDIYDLRSDSAAKLFEAPPYRPQHIAQIEIVTQTTRPSPIRAWETGEPIKPWTLTAYDLNKGLVKAVSDYPVILERIRDGRCNGYVASIIAQYSLFGKQLFA